MEKCFTLHAKGSPSTPSSASLGSVLDSVAAIGASETEE